MAQKSSDRCVPAMGIEWDAMNTAICPAWLLASAFCLDAQITTTLNRFPGRSSEIAIRNDSAVTLAAFAVSMAPAAGGGADGAPLTVYFDTAVDETAAALPPNEQYTVPVPSGKRPGRSWEDLYQPPILTAGVFADGTTTGDADLLKLLIWRRCYALQAVETALEILTDAGRHNVPRRQLIDHFQRIAKSLNRWYVPSGQGAGRTIYQSITGKLIDLPDGPPGSAFPPTSFVEQETAKLNRRRVVLLESRPGLATAALIRQ